jgi:NAD kinase
VVSLSVQGIFIVHPSYANHLVSPIFAHRFSARPAVVKHSVLKD